MKMNNKILTFAVGLAFLCSGTLATFAQKYVDYTKNPQDLALGDTVIMIDGNPSHYLTGEKIPKWVYTKKHTIMQIGTKRFPDGVLLREIYSWVDLHYMHKPQEVKEETQKPVVETVTTKPVEQTQPVDETQPVEQTQPAEQGDDSQVEVVEQQQPETNDEETAEEKPAGKPGFNRFSIGLRGGVASLMQQSEVNDLKWGLGYNAALDLQYSYYFARKNHPERVARHGILVDLSAAYVASPFKSDAVNDAFSKGASVFGEDFNYAINAANVKEKDGQVQVEVALMYSLLCKGFFLNVGPKVALPVFAHSSTDFALGSTISASQPSTGQTYTNAWTTGNPKDVQAADARTFKSSVANLGIAADLGYEFALKNGHALGIGLYADYFLKDWGFKKFDDAAANPSLFLVEPVAGAGANVSVMNLTNVYADKLNGFDAGLKLIYHFNFPKQF